MLTNYDECHTFLKLVIILSFMKKHQPIGLMSLLSKDASDAFAGFFYRF